MSNGTVLQQTKQSELREAVRLLLRTPLVLSSGRDKGAFANVRRHEQELRRWFQHHLGYRLVVERDFARLHKVPIRPGDASHALRRRSGKPFDRQRYSLLCLILATLDRGDQQVVLSAVAEAVHEEAQVEQLPVPDFKRQQVRQAFVDVVRFLVESGVLLFVDGDERAYLDGTGDVLYNVDGRLAAQMLSAGWNPRADLDCGDDGAQLYPDTNEGTNARIRHRLMRMLTEEPVVYIDELDDPERSYLMFQRPVLRRELGDMAGLVLEIRAEGVLALDRENELRDRTFPSTNDVAHAALQLAGELGQGASADNADHARVVPWTEVIAMTQQKVEEYGRYWSDVYQATPDGPERLAHEAIKLLADFRLVRISEAGVRALPPISRFWPKPQADRQESLI